MQRDKWTFEFDALAVATAASNKVIHHKQRLMFWTEAKSKVMMEVRDSGIEVSVSDADAYGGTSMAMRPQVMVRNDLQRRLTECHNKIHEHYEKCKEYKGWVEVLSANPKVALKLSADDYLYFFGSDQKDKEDVA